MSNISPRVDIAFKKIFGVEENKDLLISLINSIVDAKDQVSDVTLLNPYNAKNFKKDKLSILDIKARSALDNKLFNIEMQISDEADYDQRALYYWARLYTEQLKEGQGYSSLSKTIGIHILNFTSIPGTTKYHNVFKVKEETTGLSYFEHFSMHTIELNKFSSGDEQLTDIVAKIKTSLDMWIAFLTRNDLLKSDNLPKELDNDNLKKAINALEIMNFTDEERDSYEGHLKYLMLEASALKKVAQESRAEGKAEGIVEGEARGEARGKAKREIEIARKMLSKNHSISDISDLTGLSPEEISKL